MVSPSRMTTQTTPDPAPLASAQLSESKRDGAARIELTLSRAQIGQVMRAVTGGSAGAELLNRERSIGIDEALYRELLSDRRLSRSLLSGLMVLGCFSEDEELGIADLSRRLDMRTSTTHRYVSTLLAAGLLERDPVSRQYRLSQP